MNFMQDKYNLVSKGFIPLSKYWSMRLGFLDIINDTKLFIPLIEEREDIGDDLRVLIRISKEWNNKNEHNVGEAGALYRLLRFYSWKHNLDKTFIKEKTLKEREICDNKEIVNWPISKLLELDDNTPQWASAAILTSNNDQEEEIPDDYFLNLSKEALEHYNKSKELGIVCELRYDGTILHQAEAFTELLAEGKTDFKPKQQDDYCFARAFNLITKEDGEKRWPELRGHESNRLEEMEKQIKNLNEGKEIDSKDHRVVQAIAMRGLLEGKDVTFSHPECVSKSWPEFWEFLKEIKY